MSFIPQWERPIRIPDGIEPTRVEPSVAVVDEVGTWRMPFRLSRDVAASEPLRMQLFGGRNNYGTFSAADDGPLIAAETDDGRTLTVTPLTLKGIRMEEGTFALAVPPGGLVAGSTLAVSVGPAGNARVWHRCVRNKFALLYVAGEDNEGVVWNETNAHHVVAACLMHIVGGPLERLCVYAPPQARPGESIAVTVRPHDRHDNLASEPPGELSVQLDGRELSASREDLPNTTAVRLTLSLPREGVCRLHVRDSARDVDTVSNPIVCTAAGTQVQPYWGMIHGHTEISDGTGTLDEYFRQLRDECGLDFGATADHDHLRETSDAHWRQVREKVRAWNDPPRFVALLGYEFAKWRRKGEGDRNVYYLGDDRPMYRSDKGHCPWPNDLFAALDAAGETCLIIPHHTAAGPSYCDWQDHDPARERLVEIHQVRGSYECTPAEGNPLNERGQSEPINPVGTVRNALNMGWRVGFTAGGDDHTGRAGTDAVARANEYKAGNLCVLATARTRQAIWQALHDRHTTATSGPRILLSYTLNGQPMGSELAAAENPALREQRTLSISCHAMAPIRSIDIIRSGRVAHSIPGNGLDAEVKWTDPAPLADILLPAAKHCKHPFAYYYVRVMQTDGEVAWASPVWIDP